MEEDGEIKIVAVCDKNGNIKWMSSSKLIVIEVDGLKLNQIDTLLEENIEENEEYTKKIETLEKCPGCNKNVSLYEKICPYCGLTLIDDTYEKISKIASGKKDNDII